MRDIINDLKSMQDPKYREFNCRIIHTVPIEEMIGVRSPDIKKYAKTFSESEAFEFLEELPHRYYEENAIHSNLIVRYCKDITTSLKYIEDFLPFIDNWAICDTISPKIFRKNPDIVYEHVCIWLQSERTYTVRFGIVTLLQFFLDENYRPEILNMIAEIRSEEYYINIAIAWFFSYALIKQFHDTFPYIEKGVLDKWIHNKSIQKAVESYRISEETKQLLKTYKKR
ncbi:MAG: DNA alkylation repair protein [Bacteroidales bacterium]|nr:DNA alkylation repair protein [Bacteroidales bacterium]